MSSEPEAEPTFAPLQFDRAEPAESSGSPSLLCERCAKPIVDTYYHDGEKMLCAGCGILRQQMSAPDASPRTFLRAAAFGLGAALAGAVLYFAVIKYFGPFSIVALAIGWMVGHAIAKATNGRSARRHQLLSVMLTYLSVALAYAPYAIGELQLAGAGDLPARALMVLALPIALAIGTLPVGILSLLLLGYGLRQAWTISGASNVAVTGPHAIGASTAQ